MKILVVCEHDGGKVKKGSLEVLGNAVTWGGEVHALILGAPGALDAPAKELAAFGPAKVHCAEHANLATYSPEGFAKVVADAAKSLSADSILASVSARTKDYFPRMAVKLEAGMASDCVSVSASGGALTVKRPLYAGKCVGTVEFTAKPHIATVRPNALGMKPASGAAAAVEKLSCDPGTIRAKVSEVVSKSGGSAKIDLTEANRIVSGGRSLKTAENFKILEDLAGVIGAAVGASRAAVDAGYRPHSDQVGQTGKTVSPTLYMAFGISGAIQHLAGMRTSKVIVAVNTDANAPIFQKADFGVVADLFQMAPALTEEFKKVVH